MSFLQAMVIIHFILPLFTITFAHNDKHSIFQHDHQHIDSNQISHRKTHKCNHDISTQTTKVTKSRINYENHPYSNSIEISANSQQRSLLNIPSSQTEPIRISVYYDPVTISTTNGLTPRQINYIKETTSASVNFYESFMSVIPVSGPLTYYGCTAWKSYLDDGTIACTEYALTCGETTTVPSKIGILI